MNEKEAVTDGILFNGLHLKNPLIQLETFLSVDKISIKQF